MKPSLLRPQGNLTPTEALRLAQQAPEILRKNPKAFSVSPLSSLFSATETPEVWTIYENLLLACLRTENDEAAHHCLERLVLRFGGKDERIEALKGLMKEAQASSNGELEQILKEYEAIIIENGTNLPIAKRRVALFRSMGRIADAIEALTLLLEYNPTDPEAWMELADLYLSQGLYPQAIHAIEEALVLAPNAWNLHARLGEVFLMAAESSPGETTSRYIAEGLKRFCRSIELCGDYLRGYYGLKLITDKILAGAGKVKKPLEADGFPLPEQLAVEKLNAAAVSKLGEIVRRYDAGDKLCQGYNAGEVEAARELLGKTTTAGVVR